MTVLSHQIIFTLLRYVQYVYSYVANILQAAGHHHHPTPLRSGDSAHLLYNLRNKVKALQTENMSLKMPTKQLYTSTPDLTANYSFTEEVRTQNVNEILVEI